MASFRKVKESTSGRRGGRGKHSSRQAVDHEIGFSCAGNYEQVGQRERAQLAEAKVCAVCVCSAGKSWFLRYFNARE